ncbi:MAG: hypothetical protein HY985_04905 [Magnetospirillum sp.]|nr:hypothetical protein [Magnetospirillum sp.]
MNAINHELLHTKAGAALRQALTYLETEADRSGFAEVAHLIGCAMIALEESLGCRCGGDALH